MTTFLRSVTLELIAKFLTRLIGFFVVLFFWHLAYVFEWLNHTLLPSPLDSISHLVSIILSGDVIPDVTSTMNRTFTGFFLAVFVGVIIGLIIGISIFVYDLLSVVIDFFRSIPVTTLYPLFVLLFGIGDTSKIAMVFTAAVFVIILNTAYGVRHASPTRVQMATLFGASPLQTLVWVTFYNALPQILIGLRVAISYSLIVAIVAEMFMGSDKGIGQRVFEAYNTYLIDELYALVILVGFLGYSINLLLLVVEKKANTWVAK